MDKQDQTLYVVARGSAKAINLAEIVIGGCELACQKALPVFTNEWTARFWLRERGFGAQVFPMPRKLVKIFARILVERGTRHFTVDPPRDSAAPCEFWPMAVLLEGH